MRIWRRDQFVAGFSAALGASVLLLLCYMGWRLMGAVAAIITPFVAAYAVALILEPLVSQIQRHVRFFHGKRLPAVFLVYALFLSAFVALLTYLVPNLIDQGKDLALKLPAYVDSFRKLINAWLAVHHKMGPFRLPKNIDQITKEYSDRINKAMQGYASQAAQIVLGSLSGLLTVVLVPIITFYLLSDLHRLQARFVFLLPSKMRPAFQKAASDVGGVFGNYVRGMVIVSTAYGLVAMVIFFAFGLRSYALLLGVAAGVLYAVPYVGPLMTSLLAAIVSIATGHATGSTLLLLGLILAQNQIFDNVVVPRIVGDSVGLHPLLTIFSLFLGGELFGIWGMLFSVPVAASIQLILFRLFPKLCAPTPVSLGTRSDNLPLETVTRSADEADLATSS